MIRRDSARFGAIRRDSARFGAIRRDSARFGVIQCAQLWRDSARLECQNIRHSVTFDGVSGGLLLLLLPLPLLMNVTMMLKGLQGQRKQGLDSLQYPEKWVAESCFAGFGRIRQDSAKRWED